MILENYLFMKVITKDEFKVEDVINGKIFVYPTDTIYGIGCNALDSFAVKKLREIKNQGNRPVSIIAPSKEWIKKNCEVNSESEKWLDKLPGPYTLIMKLKNRIIPEEINLGSGTVGVRMPDHWITNLCNKCGVPIVTTSANKSGEPFMISIKDLNKEVGEAVDFVVYEGPINGSPSTLINLVTGEVVKR